MTSKTSTRSSQRRAKPAAATPTLRKPVGKLPTRKKTAAPPAFAAPVVTADSPPAADDVSRQAIRLAFLIHDVSRMRRAAYDQLMKPFNFTRARWWVLATLSRHDGMMQSQLADVLEVGKASLGSVVEQLEADGWLERRSDPSDKRAKRVYLTRSAQPFIKKMTLEEDDFNGKILSKLDTADRNHLIRLLGMIKESLQQLAKIDAGES